ncbi:MAG TPA: glycosyltransferase family 39 protein, partial [Thermoanaerobaculia bacterium]|nr:glycosyltransferase family 39 protein [Thermoanaerobaculia bacterium]
RRFRLELLIDPEPAWALARLLLGLSVLVAAVCAGGGAAAILSLWNRSKIGTVEPGPIPLSRRTLAVLAAAGLLAGVLLRMVWLDRVPSVLFQDDVTLMAPALELEGALGDFRDSIRAVPYGVAKPFGSVGVLYLELYRASLLLFGPTVFGLRFLSALAGCACLLTAALVARELLPAGGATLALLALAGMRWHLILSRWGWNMIVIAPLLDLAVLFVLRARRRGGTGSWIAAGLLVGIGAHVYLSAWVGLVGVLALSVWPGRKEVPAAARLKIAAIVLGAFLAAASPLFLFRAGRTFSYFVRTAHHNVLAEIRYTRSLGPPVRAAADALSSAWLVGDPEPRHDLAGKSRLGWILGIPAAVALASALRFPRREFSAYLFVLSGSALAAAIAGGEGGNPNSVRFGYLSTAAGVAAAGGILILVSAVEPSRRRAAALACVGLLAINGCLGARDSILDWPARPQTWRSFHGVDTALARAAIRWERYGSVAMANGLGVEPTTIEAVRRFRLDPDAPAAVPAAPGPERRGFRIVHPSSALLPGERVVERVVDPGGKVEAVVAGRPAVPGSRTPAPRG